MGANASSSNAPGATNRLPTRRRSWSKHGKAAAPPASETLSSPIEVTQRLRFEPVSPQVKHKQGELTRVNSMRRRSWYIHPAMLNPDLPLTPSSGSYGQPGYSPTDTGDSPLTVSDMTDSASEGDDDVAARAMLKEFGDEAPPSSVDHQENRPAADLSDLAEGHHQSAGPRVPSQARGDGLQSGSALRPARVRLFTALIWPLLVVLLLVGYPSGSAAPHDRSLQSSRKPAPLAPFRFATGWPRAERRTHRAEPLLVRW
jgi:hypothetical protein